MYSIADRGDRPVFAQYGGVSLATAHTGASSRNPHVIGGVHLSGHTQQEIADAVGMSIGAVNQRTDVCSDLDKCPKVNKIAALFEDDFKAPLYNVWRFTKSSNLVQSS